MSQKIVNPLTLILIISFFIISFCVATHSYLSWDVSWLLDASRRLLAGGTYAQNFMDPNAPLILFLYAIPVLLAHYLGNLVISFLIFSYSLIALSLGLSYFILQRMVNKEVVILRLFFIALAFCELLLASYEFGQREHLCFILIVPYLLLVSGLNVSHCSTYVRCFSGIMAGLGFAIKPYFLIPLILVLVWQLCKNRRLQPSFTVENNCLLATMLLYLAACFIWTPDYFSFMLPLLFKFYLPYKEVFSDLLIHPFSIIFYVVTLLGLVQLKQKNYPYRDLYQIIVLANIGFFLVFLIQGHFWYYHLVPVASFSLLLLALDAQISFQKFKQKTNTLSSYFNVLAISASLYFLVAFLIELEVARLARKNAPDSLIRQVVQAVQQINQSPFMVFSIRVDPNATLLTYTQFRSATRLSDFWPLHSLDTLAQRKQWLLIAENKKLLKEMIVEDMLKNPPYVLVVDESDFIFSPYNAANYMDFLNKDPSFRKIWRNYHLKTRVGYYAIYVKN